MIDRVERSGSGTEDAQPGGAFVGRCLSRSTGSGVGRLLGLAVVMLLATAAQAQVPTRVPFQGLLLDADGAPVSSAVDLDFELFDALSNGTSLWSESHPGVMVVDGVYSVDLGSTNAITSAVLSGGSAFLEITVDGETLVPRQQLLAVPYSLVTENVGSVPSAIFEQMIEDFPFDGQEPGNLHPDEGAGDADGDGIANFVDPDNDNDGVNDAIELSNGTSLNLVTPTISQVTPQPITRFCPATLVVTGTSLGSVASVAFGSETPTPFSVSASQLSIDVTAPTIQPSQSVVVTLANGESATSGPVSIVSAQVAIDTLVPLFGVGEQAGSLTIEGAGFCGGTTVTIGSQTLVPTTLTDTTLVVDYQPEPISQTTVTVNHPSGATASRPYVFVSPSLTGKVVFVSDTPHDGSFGSIAAADAICQADAVAADLPGTFRAWLSNAAESGSPSSPATTFDTSGGPYLLASGLILADDWADLTDGTLNLPINVTASGLVVLNGLIWTGTQSDGTALSTAALATCDDWTSLAAQARFGTVSGTGTAWTNALTASCGLSVRLYCFEQ